MAQNDARLKAMVELQQIVLRSVGRLTAQAATDLFGERNRCPLAPKRLPHRAVPWLRCF